ncbi:MAG TPA: NAD(P)H-dependent oxidoreductase [Bellilinea sp.]|nr:NAD(P)H-dependent oxidoreductase [Bellilinea sp.]
MKIAIIIASTRPGRVGPSVAEWVLQEASKRKDAKFEMVDLAEQNLPFLNEAEQPATGKYSHETTKNWSKLINGYDGFILVTPEYNHSFPATLKNALDMLYHEWSYKPFGLVSYGNLSGARAVEALRQVLINFNAATVRPQVSLALATDFVDNKVAKPQDFQAPALKSMIDAMMLWEKGLSVIRAEIAEKKKNKKKA